MVTEATDDTTAFIQFVDDSFRPRCVSYFNARPGATAAASNLAANDDALPSTSSSVLTSHLQAWPATGYGTSVVEVGPATRKGGRLVGVGGVTATPAAFIAWLRASPLARAVSRAYVFPGGGGGTTTVRARSLGGLLVGLAPPPPGAVVRVMAFPRALEAALLGGLPEETWPVLAPKGVTHVLVALDTRARSPSDDRCVYGSGGADADADADADDASAPPPLWAALLPPDAVLACTAAERSNDATVSPCRATAKLEEALAVAGIVSLQLQRQQERCGGDEEASPATATPSSLLPAAIDVGAAPGGWTQHLARCGVYGSVIAVEPGELDPAVAAIPGVVHVRRRAEAAVEEVAAALSAGGCGSALVDLLTCDANIPIQTLGDVLGPLIPFLRPGSPAIITLKTYTPSRDKDRATAEVGAALGRLGLRAVWSLWMCANTRCERTLICVRDCVK